MGSGLFLKIRNYVFIKNAHFECYLLFVFCWPVFGILLNHFMKKFLIVVLLLSSFAAQSQEEKKTTVGLKSGVNLAIFSASVNSEPSYRTGFHAGVFLRHRIARKIYFRPEMYYSAQGEKENYGPTVGKTIVKMDYLNIPFLFEYGKKISFQFGPQICALLSAHEKGTVNQQKINSNLMEVMRTSDFGLVFGLGMNSSQNLNFGVRYNLGLSDIYVADDAYLSAPFPDIKNRVFHFYFAYNF